LYAQSTSANAVFCTLRPEAAFKKARPKKSTEQNLEALDSQNKRMAVLLQLILLTSQCPDQMASMRWQDIEGCWKTNKSRSNNQS